MAAGKLDRLNVNLPPRHGKSQLISQFFPAWFLLVYPWRRVILCSYEADFAAQWGRKVRDLVIQWGPQFGVAVASDSKAADRWEIHGHGGGMQTAGVGGPILGKGADLLILDDICIAGGQLVTTRRGEIPIENVVVGDEVITHLGRWRRVTATHDRGEKEVIAVSGGGRQVLATPEHLLYTSRGWVEAQHAEDVHVVCVPELRGGVSVESNAEVLFQCVCGSEPAGEAKGLQAVPPDFSTSQGLRSEVLLEELRNDVATDAASSVVQGMRDRVREQSVRSEVLQPDLPPVELGSIRQVRKGRDCKGAEGRAGHCRCGQRQAVPAVPRSLCGEGEAAVLLNRVQELSTCRTDAGEQEPECSARRVYRMVHKKLQGSDFSISSEQVREMHGVRVNEKVGLQPHRREPSERRNGQFDCPVQFVPHPVSQIEKRGTKRVYDLTVEEDSSFVVEGIVVHNCKNADEALSATYREKTWNWYTSTAYSRLEPGAAVVHVQQRWHTDDMTGRLHDADPGRWKSLVFPALAEEGDVLGRSPGEALWPERYSVADLEEKRRLTPTWFAAQYQQVPIDREGGFFRSLEQIPIVGAAPTADQFVRVVRAWDLAATEAQTGTDPDWTVGAKLGRHKDGTFWVLGRSAGKARPAGGAGFDPADGGGGRR